MADRSDKGLETGSGDELLKRLEDQLRDLETKEIIGGMTSEELEQRGLTGKNPIRIERSMHKETTEKEKLVFESGIEYKRLPDSQRFDEVTILSLLDLRDVAKGQLIATRNANESVEFHSAQNVKKETNGNREQYIAETKGKAVIIKDGLYVFPSDIDCKIRIRISANKMKAFMDCEPGYGEGAQLTLLTVLDEMRKQGIKHGLVEEAIAKAVNDANQLRAPQKEICVAQGTAPLKGNDGHIDFTFDSQNKGTEFRVLPDGRVDYKNTSLIQTAKKGSLLAKIVDPREGTPGINVFNETVPAETGKHATLVAGNGVSTSKDGKSFIAEMEGCIVLNPPVIEMMDVYVVNGDVDYSSGNIEFSGNVIINGNVREGFEIIANGDIIVAKNVEPSVLKAGRDVRVMGGILGKDKGFISAGRDIFAEYAQNAHLEAQGNIYIYDFAVNTRIFTSKHLILQEKHGSLVGGESHAQQGADTKVLGSAGGTKTYVNAGTDYLVQRKIREVDDSIGFCEQNMDKIDKVLKPVLELSRTNPALVASKKEMIQRTLEKRKELQHNRDIMVAKRFQLHEQLNTAEICFIKVNQICYSDVFIRIRNAKLRVSREMQNIRFYEDQNEGVIKTGAY